MKTKGSGREGGKIFLRNLLAVDKVIIGMKHAAAKSFGDQLGGEVQAPEQFVRMSPTQQLDDVSVNIGHKESHNPSSMV